MKIRRLKRKRLHCIEKLANKCDGERIVRHVDRCRNCFHEKGAVAVYLLTDSDVIVGMHIAQALGCATGPHWKYLFNFKFDNCIISCISFGIIHFAHRFCVRRRQQCRFGMTMTMVHHANGTVPTLEMRKWLPMQRALYQRLNQHFRCVQRLVRSHLCCSRSIMAIFETHMHIAHTRVEYIL